MNFTLDVSPDSSFNTIQFQTEITNAIVISVLVTFILVNYGSIVSKIVNQSPLEFFRFNSFRRFIVFEAVNDPSRVIFWLRGKYKYYREHWERNEHTINRRVLFIPVLARVVLLLGTAASIGVTIPKLVTLSGCDNGDFRLVVDKTRGLFNESLFRCENIALSSRLGTPTTSLEFCSFFLITPLGTSSPTPIGHVRISKDGMVKWELEAEQELAGYLFFFQWTRTSGNVFNSLPHLSVSAENILDTMLEGMAALGFKCERGENVTVGMEEDVIDEVHALLPGCPNFEPNEIVPTLHFFIGSSLSMEKVPDRQTRYDVLAREQTDICPIEVIQQQAIVNILPLSGFLVVIFLTNLIVTWISSRRGSTLDSWFHAMKELFRYDYRSNPLQESVGEAGEVRELTLRAVIRDDNGHVGFLPRAGDEPVDNFLMGTVVE